MNAIEVQGLVKRFDDFVAVDHLDLTIRQGELISLLGPNGAGKSTTIGILSTLVPPTEGTVTVGGFKLPDQIAQIKPLLGLVPQEIALYDTLSARRNLDFFAQLYGLRGDEARQRVTDLLKRVELDERADERLTTFSGGMQRRVNIAAALVHDPEIIFMDEPTVGLDPISREAIWKIIGELKSRGKTVVLTTHYMEEAEALSDRVAIIDHGKVIALGKPEELIEQTGVQSVLSLSVEGDAAGCVDSLEALEPVVKVNLVDAQLKIYAKSEGGLLVQVIQTLLDSGVEIRSVAVDAPSLGAVFLHFTGRELRD